MLSRTAALAFVLAPALLLGLAGVPSAGAQNLIANPDFDADLGGWTVSNNSFVQTVWQSEDARGSASSGSISITNTSASDDSRGGASQCIPVIAGADYRIRGEVQIPAGQPTSGNATVTLFWAPEPDCNGFISGQVGIRQNDRGAWTILQDIVTAPPGAASVRISLTVFKTVANGTLEAWFDRLRFQISSATACVPDANTLCLNNDRFRVTANWRRPDDSSGMGSGVELTGDTGYFWFFNPANVEMVVKVLDNCAGASQRFWVFAGGLTNVEVDLRVEDIETGQVRIYQNPLRSPFEPIQDTDAFDSCP